MTQQQMWAVTYAYLSFWVVACLAWLGFMFGEWMYDKWKGRQ